MNFLAQLKHRVLNTFAIYNRLDAAEASLKQVLSTAITSHTALCERVERSIANSTQVIHQQITNDSHIVFEAVESIRAQLSGIRVKSTDTEEIVKKFLVENKSTFEKIDELRAAQLHISLELKRLNNFIPRQAKAENSERIPSRKIRVHFYFQAAEVWTTWESVWRACVDHPCIDPTMVLLPFIHDSQFDPEGGRRFLAKSGIPFINHTRYHLDEQLPDLVFLQNPYDSTRPQKYSTLEIRRKLINIAYIPYGLDVGGGEANIKWQYDLDTQRNAWRIFVRSEDHRKMYGRHCEAGNRHTVVTGHPKIDQIVSKSRLDESLLSSAGVSGDVVKPRKVFLWTPHFTVDEQGWSTFRIYCEELLRYFENRPDGVSLLVRPHPLFFGRMRSLGFLDEFEEQQLKSRLDNAPFIALDENAEYITSFNISDALLADAGSFLLEYLPTGKPILYLERLDGPGLNESAKFVDSYYRARRIDDIIGFIDMVVKEYDPKKDERIRQISEVLHRVDGRVGDSIAEYIVQNILSAV